MGTRSGAEYGLENQTNPGSDSAFASFLTSPSPTPGKWAVSLLCMAEFQSIALTVKLEPWLAHSRHTTHIPSSLPLPLLTRPCCPRY